MNYSDEYVIWGINGQVFFVLRKLPEYIGLLFIKFVSGHFFFDENKGLTKFKKNSFDKVQFIRVFMLLITDSHEQICLKYILKPLILISYNIHKDIDSSTNLFLSQLNTDFIQTDSIFMRSVVYLQ